MRVCAGRPCSRRELLQAAAAGATLLVAGPAGAQSGARPAPGDLLVAAGAEAGDHSKALTIEDLSVDQAVLAYPMDPGSGTVKKDRAALIVLVRLQADAIDPAIRPRAAGGILGYSALCTHMACIVDQYTAFGSGQKELRCRCHGSVYDPRRGAVVLDGPAPRPLPAIPLAVRAGKLVVAGDFTGKVGP